MDFFEARKLAHQLMDEHGVSADGWRFQWSSGKRQLGVAQIRERHNARTGKTELVKTIKLSRYMVAMNSDDEVRETILHEIAHAIAGVKHGHNDVWKAVCRRIGAKPQRVAGDEVRVVATRFVVVCADCRRVLANRHRRMNPDRLRQAYCRWCGVSSKGKLRMDYAQPAHTAASTTSPPAT